MLRFGFTLIALLEIIKFGEGYSYSDYRRRPHVCVPIEERACSGSLYNVTVMPNILGHENQRDAMVRFHEFQPLLDTNCSPKLQFFLCSLLFPMCTPKVDVPVPGCRQMCEEVRDKCEPYMAPFGFSWSIDCRKLPYLHEEGRLCMQPPDSEEEEEGLEEAVEYAVHYDVYDDVYGTYPDGESPDPAPPVNYEDEDDRAGSEWVGNIGGFGAPGAGFGVPGNDFGFEDANYDWVRPETDSVDQGEVQNFDYVENSDVIDQEESKGVGNDGNKFVKEKKPTCKNPNKFYFVESAKECVPRCEQGTDVLFRSTHKIIAYWMLVVCSAVCFISTSITICTFAVDTTRFRYPVRPIIFMSICYCFYSVAYLVRAGMGPDSNLSCVKGQEVHHIVKWGFEGNMCTTVFCVLYYFGMAASAWWVVLSLTWLLSAGLKWSDEAIGSYGFYYHLVSWCLPAFQTISALLMAKVDGDELTGMCYVGNLDPDSLMYFVIIPMTFYLLIGGVILLFGFSYLLKIRRVIRHQSKNEAGSFEKLILRIGVFTVLYTVPAICLLAVNFYQYKNYRSWITRAEDLRCLVSQNSAFYYNQYPAWNEAKNAEISSKAWSHFQGQNKFDAASQVPVRMNCSISDSVPSFTVFMIKIFMSLVVGITCGMWVWSKKTLKSWKDLCRIHGCQSNLTSSNASDNVETLQVSSVESHNVEETSKRTKSCDALGHLGSGQGNERRARLNEYVAVPQRQFLLKNETQYEKRNSHLFSPSSRNFQSPRNSRADSSPYHI